MRLLMNTFLIVWLIVGAFASSGCGDGVSADCSDVEKSMVCSQDSDCSCGVHIVDDTCFYGNKKCVNEGKQCPDFCTGFAGQLEIRCIGGACTQVVSE
jgi:hypothetical protein